MSITQGVKESKNQSGQGIMGKRKPHYRGSYIGGWGFDERKIPSFLLKDKTFV